MQNCEDVQPDISYALLLQRAVSACRMLYMYDRVHIRGYLLLLA